MIEKYGILEARKRTYFTTDKIKGALRKLAEEENIETFIIPDNVGGRFSVFTAVGLLPIATAGIDVFKLLRGANTAQKNYYNKNLLSEDNDAYIYAVLRYLLHAKHGKDIEILATFEPKLRLFVECYKQLFGESEGKQEKGIFPTGAIYSTDLHSMGQMIQQGKRNIFETFIETKYTPSKKDIIIMNDSDNYDNLNYLEGKTIKYVEKQALEGTIKAHYEGNVPIIRLGLEKIDAESIGYLMYFFQISVAISARLNDVNPFNQPGVEEYKKNMLNLLKNEEV